MNLIYFLYFISYSKALKFVLSFNYPHPSVLKALLIPVHFIVAEFVIIIFYIFITYIIRKCPELQSLNL